MSGERCQVVVVGGGPAGAAAALGLARRGAEVVLLDRARFPRPKPCGQFVGPAGARLLGTLGLWEAVRAAGASPTHGIRIEAPDGSAVIGHFPDGPTDVPVPFALSREHLDAALLARARLAGVRILEEHQVIAVEVGPTEAVLRTRAGRDLKTLRAEWVIGADGRHSAVARALGLPRRLLRLRRFGVLADFADFPQPGDTAELFIGRGAYCIINPLADGQACLGLVTDWCPEACRGGPAELLARHLAAFPAVAQRVARARLIGRAYGVGPLAFRREPPGAGRVLLVGDAAGFYDPLTGEGVTAALETGTVAAALLADGLASGAGPGVIQAAHAAARRRLLGSRWRFLALLQAVIRRPGLSSWVARRLTRHPRALAALMEGVAGPVPGSMRGGCHPGASAGEPAGTVSLGRWGQRRTGPLP